MFVPLLIALAAAPSLPKECEQPVLREVGPLKELASLDGAFSAGLDAVATWCFDSGGGWNAGVQKPKKPISIDAPPTADCLKAISSCEGTHETVRNKAPLRELAGTALTDFDRPYRGGRYQPKRSGLKENPSRAADCRSKSRTELFYMAQQRMDLARLTSQIQNEYANYKTWLFARGLECRNEVAANKKDTTNFGISVDQSKAVEPVGPTSKDPEIAAAVKAPIVEKWKAFASLQSRAETNRDFTLGFLASRELRGCDCTRVNPAAVVRALEKKEGGEAGLSLLKADDPANTKCAVCTFEVFPLWSARVQKQCSTLDGLSDSELGLLEKSDDMNGLPPRCVEETKGKRAEKARLLAEAAQAKAAAEAKAAADAKATSDARAAAEAKVASDARAAEQNRAAAQAKAIADAKAAADAKVAAEARAAADARAIEQARAAGGAKAAAEAKALAEARAAADARAAAAARAAADAKAATELKGSAAARAAADAKAADEWKAVSDAQAAAPVVPGRDVAAAPRAGAPNTNLQTVDGYTYFRPGGAAAAGNPAAGGTPPGANPAAGTNPAVGANPAVGNYPAAGTNAAVGGAVAGPAGSNRTVAAAGGPMANPTGPGTEEFTPPSSWAPIPQREDGRIYVRLFMSRACVADINPGPLQAQTGDLLLLPFDAKYLQVKSPCGGLAEVYFGREARPRVSETFGRTTGLKFEFKRQ